MHSTTAHMTDQLTAILDRLKAEYPDQGFLFVALHTDGDDSEASIVTNIGADSLGNLLDELSLNIEEGMEFEAIPSPIEPNKSPNKSVH